MKERAGDLLAALARKHSGDVFVPECKNGPTHTASHRRFDAWVLLKTWSPITSIGYEIKVDRQDWLRDDKIGEYMGLCHLFYLVAPKGLIPVSELPESVGLLEPVGDGTRLVTRRKAGRRSIEMPIGLLVYVLMCRAKIGREDSEQSFPHWRTQQLREWVNGKEDRRGLSYAVSSKIQDKFADQEKRLTALHEKCERLARVEARIIEMGFDPDSSSAGWQAEERLRNLAAIISTNLLSEMERLSSRLTSVKADLQALRQPKAVA